MSMKKNDWIVIVAIIIVVIALKGGIFSLYPPVNTLPVGSCVDYQGGVWKITGNVDASRGIVPVQLIGYVDGHIDSRIGIIDGFSQYSTNDFKPLDSCSITSVNTTCTNRVCSEFGTCVGNEQKASCVDSCGTITYDTKACQPIDNTQIAIIAVLALIVIGAVIYRRK